VADCVLYSAFSMCALFCDNVWLSIHYPLLILLAKAIFINLTCCLASIHFTF